MKDINMLGRDISECRNIAEGSVFIIASGSSAKNFPIDKFKNIPMIAVNGAISMFLGKNISPYFYVCTDTGFFTQQEKLFHTALKLSQRVVLREDCINYDIPKPKGKLYIVKKAPKKNWKSWLPKNKENLIYASEEYGRRSSSIGFSKDLSLGYFDARTVAYLAVQVAYHAGFNKVFIVGLDLSPDTGRFYENETTNKSPCVLDKHLGTRIIPSFKLISEKIYGDSFEVYNLSPISKMPRDIIPYVPLPKLEEIIHGK